MRCGSQAALHALLNEPSITPNELDPSGFSPVFEALQKGDLKSLAVLVERGQADLNSPCTSLGDLPVFVSLQSHGTLRALVEHGADIAAEAERSGATAMSHACSAGDSALVKLLVDLGVDPTKPCDAMGFTPAYHAIGQPDVLGTLVRCGVDLNEPVDPSGCTLA